MLSCDASIAWFPGLIILYKVLSINKVVRGFRERGVFLAPVAVSSFRFPLGAATAIIAQTTVSVKMEVERRGRDSDILVPQRC